jgi:hypothetical protein
MPITTKSSISVKPVRLPRAPAHEPAMTTPLQKRVGEETEVVKFIK